MSTARSASLLAATCAVLYLLVLPALPDSTSTASNLQWLLSVVVAVTGIVALVVALRSRRRTRE